MPKAVEVLDAAKFYRVNKEVLTSALPRQMPQVDITKGGDKGMEIAVADMVHARLSQVPAEDHRYDTAQGSAGLSDVDRTGALESIGASVAEARRGAPVPLPSWAATVA